MRAKIDEAAFVARTFARAGMVKPENPLLLIKSLDVLRRWGTSIAGGYASAAVRRPNATALIDDAGSLSYRELDQRANALARGLSAAGVGPGDGIAVLCRNHRYFVEVTVAADRIGADLIFLNTMFAAPQVSEVCDQESPIAIVYDEEFSETVAAASVGRTAMIAWTDGAASRAAFGCSGVRRVANLVRSINEIHGTKPVVGGSHKFGRGIRAL